MKPDSVLLNGARGPVVDLDALAASLGAGHLAGAGLDVFPDEPFAADHPIKECEQVVMTPHAADQTPERFYPFQGGGCFGCHAVSRNGRKMQEHQPRAHKALEPTIAYVMTHILRGEDHVWTPDTIAKLQRAVN